MSVTDRSLAYSTWYFWEAMFQRCQTYETHCLKVNDFVLQFYNLIIWLRNKMALKKRNLSVSLVGAAAAAAPPGSPFYVAIFWSIAAIISATTTWNLAGCDIAHVHITSATVNVFLPPQVWWASTSPRSKSSSQSWYTWPKAPRSSWNASLLESKIPSRAFVVVTNVIVVLIF